MPPLTPLRTTRLAPGQPLLWRDAQTIQIGAGGPRIPVENGWIERLLSRMSAGFRREAFDVIAHAAGAPRDEARALRDRVGDLLIDDSPSPRAAWVESVDLSDHRCEYRMRESLADEGILLGERSRPGDVVVVLVPGAAAALQFGAHLRDDIPHLPVAFGRGTATIGPLVIPGRTPCLACRDAHERDRDEAWPRLHAQMIGRDGGSVTAAVAAGAGRVVAELLVPSEEQQTRVVHLSADGSRESSAVTFHEECLCRVPSSRSRRGSGREPVRLVPPIATTTPTAFARRA